METQVRIAREADLTAVTRLVYDAYRHYVARIGREPGPMLDDYALLIEEGRVHLLENEGRICGILVLLPQDDAMLLDNVAVSPEDQGKGFGRMLISIAEEATRSTGFDRIRLYTNKAMTENIALYTRLGFHETHRVTEQGLDRVYMEKKLG